MRETDFHSLRHTLATNLARRNIAPRVAMQIMRHSDIRLTMNHYTDSSQLPVAAVQSGARPIGQPSIDSTRSPARNPNFAARESGDTERITILSSSNAATTPLSSAGPQMMGRT